ncbi:MAG TPA: class I SAM-dependent methyltransferase [Rhizomicrobium sp.]|jgi:predicted O-methyltransferase YrrM|nr:class I SAM-dependent methyltransferase [Rhizomicrobium sp.]
MSVLNDAGLEALLDALHAQSDGQSGAIDAYFARRIKEGTLSWDGFDAETHGFFRDKMVALEKDKAEYCYALCRALRATRVVECGTSFGVSTLYLAAAVRDNGGGTVIATEYEAAKAEIARRNFAAAGLASFIDLREGDLADTLQTIEGPVDFVLFDIWTEAVMPALVNLAPHLRPGAILLADNAVSARRGYAAYFAYIADPANRLRTLTLPFAGGLEMTVRV